MKQITAKDGSITFYNEYFQDVYKSVTGAVEEAREKFVKPCRIPELAKTGKIKILDVCFGIGYNSLLAIDEALKANPNCVMEIIGLENDPEVIEQILKMKFNEELKKDYEHIKKAAKNCIEGKKEKKEQITVKIILGDARETVNQIKEEFDAVFLDPFTPKTCPHLWTEKFISDIAKRMKKGSIMATYSCARFVRENMKKTSLTVYNGPSVGRYAPSTFAIKN